MGRRGRAASAKSVGFRLGRGASRDSTAKGSDMKGLKLTGAVVISSSLGLACTGQINDNGPARPGATDTGTNTGTGTGSGTGGSGTPGGGSTGSTTGGSTGSSGNSTGGVVDPGGVTVTGTPFQP